MGNSRVLSSPSSFSQVVNHLLLHCETGSCIGSQPHHSALSAGAKYAKLAKVGQTTRHAHLAPHLQPIEMASCLFRHDIQGEQRPGKETHSSLKKEECGNCLPSSHSPTPASLKQSRHPDPPMTYTPNLHHPSSLLVRPHHNRSIKKPPLLTHEFCRKLILTLSFQLPLSLSLTPTTQRKKLVENCQVNTPHV